MGSIIVLPHKIERITRILTNDSHQMKNKSKVAIKLISDPIEENECQKEKVVK